MSVVDEVVDVVAEDAKKSVDSLAVAKEKKKFMYDMFWDSQRWKFRRLLSFLSFVLIMFTLFFYTTVGLWASNEMCKRVSDFNGVVIPIIGFLAGIIAMYIGLSSHSEKTMMNSVQNLSARIESADRPPAPQREE